MITYFKVILVIVVIILIRSMILGSRHKKQRKQTNAKYGIGEAHKKERGVKDMAYVYQCFSKGQKEKGIAALEGIAAQEGWLIEMEDIHQRSFAARFLLHLAILGSCEMEYRSLLSVQAPEYKSLEKAREIAGWLLEDEKRDCAIRARNNKSKAENYPNYTYFILALLSPAGQERFRQMKRAAEAGSSEACRKQQRLQRKNFR